MSLLTIVQDACVGVGIARPSSVIANSSEEVTEMLFFAKKEGFELMRRFNWQKLRKEKTETTLAAEQQTALPSDFDRFVNETFWNRSRKHMLYGPLTPQDWQRNKNWTSSPVTDSFTVRGGNILINPAPAAGETIAYEYISQNYCTSSAGVEQSTWADDTDLAILNETIITQGLITRFKLAKGLDANADVAEYETQVMLAIGYDSPHVRVNMASSSRVFSPKILTQDGDWNVS